MIVLYLYDDDESFDSNYKLFKNQRGEAFARYIGPNCRNGPPKKKIWVPKSVIEELPVTVLLTMPAEDVRYKLKMARQNEYMHTSSNSLCSCFWEELQCLFFQLC